MLIVILLFNNYYVLKKALVDIAHSCHQKRQTFAYPRPKDAKYYKNVRNSFTGRLNDKFRKNITLP